MTEDIINKTRNLIVACQHNDEEIAIIVAKKHQARIAVSGYSADLCAALDTCIKAARNDEGTNSQKMLGEMILDVITVNFSPQQIADEVANRVDKLIP